MFNEVGIKKSLTKTVFVFITSKKVACRSELFPIESEKLGVRTGADLLSTAGWSCKGAAA